MGIKARHGTICTTHPVHVISTTTRQRNNTMKRTIDHSKTELSKALGYTEKEWDKAAEIITKTFKKYEVDESAPEDFVSSGKTSRFIIGMVNVWETGQIKDPVLIIAMTFKVGCAIQKQSMLIEALQNTIDDEDELKEMLSKIAPDE